MKIYLIGMPLSGKSTIGKLLANELNYRYIDLDNYIENEYNVSIDELLTNNQEAKFRSLETKALKACLSADKTIISTGGGIIEDLTNKDYMAGPIVFLDVNLDVLEKRQKDAKIRPLLKTNTLLEIYKRRINKYYSFADIVVKEEKKEDILKVIIKSLREEGYLWKV